MRRIANAGWFALMLLGLAMALGVASCASRQSTLAGTRKAIAVAWAGTEKAHSAFDAWESHADPAKGKTGDEGLRLLEQHEARVARINGALAVVYAALDAAVLMLGVVEAGDADPATLYDVTIQAVTAAQRLAEAMREVVR
jgi:hypothetical protein